MQAALDGPEMFLIPTLKEILIKDEGLDLELSWPGLGSVPAHSPHPHPHMWVLLHEASHAPRVFLRGGCWSPYHPKALLWLQPQRCALQTVQVNWARP